MSPERKTSRNSAGAGAALLGALLGGIVGAVLAVNIVIFAGVEGGYEASPSDVFDQRPVAALTILAVLVFSPVVGAFVALKRRRSRRS